MVLDAAPRVQRRGEGLGRGFSCGGAASVLRTWADRRRPHPRALTRLDAAPLALGRAFFRLT